ncbi:MAG: hypothetical protein WBH03_08375 [Cyclobacteriaceae bacterium]
MEQLELGDAFIVPTPPKEWHLYIIIVAISENNYLLASTTTANTERDPDRDCIINPGTGVPKFITCQSTIAYRHVREYRNNDIIKFIKANTWQYNGRFSEEQVYQMQLKGASSKRIKHKYKKILQEVVKIEKLYKLLG